MWKTYLDCLVEMSPREADAALLDLRRWMDRGGAAPYGFNRDEFMGLLEVLPAKHMEWRSG